jgi:hypothetical protein
MHRVCDKCGTVLVDAKGTCGACGTSIDSDIAPDELGVPPRGAVSGAIEADKRRRVRLALKVAAFGLLLGVVVIFANRSSPPNSSPTTDSRQDAKPIIAYGEKPSPAIKQIPEDLPHTVKPRNNSSAELASPGQTRSEVTNNDAVRAGGAQPKASVTTQVVDHPLLLQFKAGVQLWIRVNSIRRQPDGSFSFRGTLLQPITLTDSVSLDQSTELVGWGTVNGGHTMVSVTEFTVRGENYGLRSAGSANKKPGSGPAVELNPGKLLEMWFASVSVYAKKTG